MVSMLLGRVNVVMPNSELTQRDKLSYLTRTDAKGIGHDKSKNKVLLGYQKCPI